MVANTGPASSAYGVGSDTKNIVQPGAGKWYSAGAVWPHEKGINNSWNCGNDPAQFLLDGLRLFARRDIFDRAFVEYDFAIGVTYRPHVRRYPLLLAIFAVDFEFEIVHWLMFVQQGQFAVLAGIGK